MARRMIVLSGCFAALTLSACASSPPTPETPPAETSEQPVSPPSSSSPSTPAASTAVTGTVTYRERIALTPEAVIHVEVVEVSPDGRPGDVIGEQTLRAPGQVPVAFTVPVPAERIRADSTYFVQARITDGPRTLTTPQPVPVLTQGARTTDVQLLVRTGN